MKKITKKFLMEVGQGIVIGIIITILTMTIYWFATQQQDEVKTQDFSTMNAQQQRVATKDVERMKRLKNFKIGY